MTLDGKVAIVTGAASGIGRRTAELFAERGAAVLAVDIDDEGLEETVRRVRTLPDAEAMAMVADVSDADDTARFVDRAVSAFGGIDILYNNAGIAQEATPIEAIAESDWERILAVNLRGPFLGMQAAIPRMREQEGGVILNTASVSGLRPREGLAAYTAAKGGLITLTKQAAAELADDDIRVNALCPVAADTPMLTEFTDGLDRDVVTDHVTETIPLGRLSDPVDVAHAAAFLASEEARMITGVALPVDGGRGI